MAYPNVEILSHTVPLTYLKVKALHTTVKVCTSERLTSLLSCYLGQANHLTLSTYFYLASLLLAFHT